MMCFIQTALRHSYIVWARNGRGHARVPRGPLLTHITYWPNAYLGHVGFELVRPIARRMQPAVSASPDRFSIQARCRTAGTSQLSSHWHRSVQQQQVRVSHFRGCTAPTLVVCRTLTLLGLSMDKIFDSLIALEGHTRLGGSCTSGVQQLAESCANDCAALSLIITSDALQLQRNSRRERARCILQRSSTAYPKQWHSSP